MTRLYRTVPDLSSKARNSSRKILAGVCGEDMESAAPHGQSQLDFWNLSG